MRNELDRRVIPEVVIDLVPLPKMLVPLTVDELRAYRDELRERFRKLAVPQ
jgi:hypothetical protein